MKLKFVYFSDFLLELSMYNKEKMDFFVYLLMQIISEDKIESNLSLEEILLDLSIPREMLYLFNNTFYFLYDNNLIKAKDDTIENIKKHEISLTSLGEICFRENYLPVYSDTTNKQVIYNPLNNKLEAVNDFNNQTDIIVIDHLIEDVRLRELLNNFKMSIFPDLDEDMIIDHKVIEVNPFLVEVELVKRSSIYYFKNKEHLPLGDYLSSNLIYLKDKNDTFSDEDGVVLTNNVCFKFVIGDKLINSLNSDYYLIIDDSKAFKIENNNIYLPSEIKSIIDDNIVVYSDSLNLLYYKEVELENKLFLPLVNLNKKRGLDASIKKWLEKNINKFEDKHLVESIIKLL